MQVVTEDDEKLLCDGEPEAWMSGLNPEGGDISAELLLNSETRKQQQQQQPVLGNKKAERTSKSDFKWLHLIWQLHLFNNAQ